MTVVIPRGDVSLRWALSATAGIGTVLATLMGTDLRVPGLAATTAAVGLIANAIVVSAVRRGLALPPAVPVVASGLDVGIALAFVAAFGPGTLPILLVPAVPVARNHVGPLARMSVTVVLGGAVLLAGLLHDTTGWWIEAALLMAMSWIFVSAIQSPARERRGLRQAAEQLADGRWGDPLDTNRPGPEREVLKLLDTSRERVHQFLVDLVAILDALPAAGPDAAETAQTESAAPTVRRAAARVTQQIAALDESESRVAATTAHWRSAHRKDELKNPNLDFLVTATTEAREALSDIEEAVHSVTRDATAALGVFDSLSSLTEQLAVVAHDISLAGRRSHVLALNAAIEAAHAGGEAGGFTSVAHDVRELSSQVTESGRTIEVVAEEIQYESQQANRGLNAVLRTAEQIERAVTAALEKVAHTTDAVDSLTHAAEDRRALVHELDDAMTELIGRIGQWKQLASDARRLLDEATARAVGVDDRMARCSETARDLSRTLQALHAVVHNGGNLP